MIVTCARLRLRTSAQRCTTAMPLLRTPLLRPGARLSRQSRATIGASSVAGAAADGLVPTCPTGRAAGAAGAARSRTARRRLHSREACTRRVRNWSVALVPDGIRRHAGEDGGTRKNKDFRRNLAGSHGLLPLYVDTDQRCYSRGLHQRGQLDSVSLRTLI